MSKIGRKTIDIGKVKVDIKGNEVHYSGPKNSGVYVLPSTLIPHLESELLSIGIDEVQQLPRDINREWGLHRALLFNAIQGAGVGFEKKIQINGLGYKAVLTGSKIVFSLGYSHKVDFELPKGVSVEIDRSGQNLTFTSYDKELVGHVCSVIKSFRPTEPYKGTGIKLSTEVIARKAGKTKAK